MTGQPFVLQSGKSCLAQLAEHSSVFRPSSCLCNSQGDCCLWPASQPACAREISAGTSSPAAATAPNSLLLGLGEGGQGAEGENSMDVACRPSMESAQHRLSRAPWLHFEWSSQARRRWYLGCVVCGGLEGTAKTVQNNFFDCSF